MFQQTTAKGRTITIMLRNGRTETHGFATPKEARARAAFIAEAIDWIGTPFRDCADIKGRGGGVDCAMLLVRCAVDTGLMKPFDPRPYPPRWHMHKSEERFLNWIKERLGACETDNPQIGDVAVYKFGKCFSHGAIVASTEEVVHAWYASQQCTMSRRDEPLLCHQPMLGPRSVKYFNLWTRKT